MKSILNIAIALLAILSVTAAFTLHSVPTGNAQWTQGPCVTDFTDISGMATGLGTGPYFAHITGEYDCVNNGKNTPGSDNWSELDIIVPVSSKKNGTGGNSKISFKLESLCDHANWTFKTRNLECTIYDNGALNGPSTLGPTDIETCF